MLGSVGQSALDGKDKAGSIGDRPRCGSKTHPCAPLLLAHFLSPRLECGRCPGREVIFISLDNPAGSISKPKNQINDAKAKSTPQISGSAGPLIAAGAFPPFSLLGLPQFSVDDTPRSRRKSDISPSDPPFLIALRRGGRALLVEEPSAFVSASSGNNIHDKAAALLPLRFGSSNAACSACKPEDTVESKNWWRRLRVEYDNDRASTTEGPIFATL